jgi:hypothetical protein
MDLSMPGYMKRDRTRKDASSEEEVAPSPKSPRKLPEKGEKGEKGKGGERRTVRTLPKEVFTMKDAMEDLTVANAELSLEKAIDTREAAGFLLRTVLVPTVIPMIADGLDEAKAFAKEVRKSRGQDIGPAHIRIFLAAMKGLAGWEVAVGDPLLKGPLEVFWNEVVLKVDADTLREQVQIFKIFKPKVMGKIKVGEVELGEYARVVLRFRPGTKTDSRAEDLQDAFLAFARRQGWKVQVGTAPKSAKERKLADLLAKVKGK